MDTQSQFEAVAHSIDALQSPTERTAAAMELFGRGGKEMIHVLHDVATGADKMHVVMSDLAAQGLESMNVTPGAQNFMEGLKQVVGTDILRLETMFDDFREKYIGNGRYFTPASWGEMAEESAIHNIIELPHEASIGPSFA